MHHYRLQNFLDVIQYERQITVIIVIDVGGRRPLRRPRPRWLDNIRKDLQEVGCGCMDWIGLAQDTDR